jgi:hypothetical protein
MQEGFVTKRRNMEYTMLTRKTVLTCAVLLAWGAYGPGFSQETSKERSNLAADSHLPRGKGLAAEFRGDRGIESHPAVIFADSFEGGDYRDRWDSCRDKGEKVLSLVDDSESSPVVGHTSLRVEATLGQNTGGGVTKWFESADTLFIRFYTKFDPTCDYVHHFCTLRANKSLRGKDRWSGFGGAGIKPQGNERFSTALEPWGNWGRWSPPGRWNFYTYWHEMEQSRDGKYWGNSFRPEFKKDIPRGRWICCEFMVKHNTPDKYDGEQAFWIDGELRGHWQGINWRTSATLWANAFTLESYVTDRWTKNKVNIVYFDNVVIAREYIGPVGKER